jgi:hypothetical protein
LQLTETQAALSGGCEAITQATITYIEASMARTGASFPTPNGWPGQPRCNGFGAAT